jgi:hypothetical protein
LVAIIAFPPPADSSPGIMGCIHNPRIFILAIRTTHQNPFNRTDVAAIYGDVIGNTPTCGICWACILAYLCSIDKPLNSNLTLKYSMIDKLPSSLSQGKAIPGRG